MEIKKIKGFFDLTLIRKVKIKEVCHNYIVVYKY